MRPFEALLIAATAAGVLRSTAFAGFGWPSWSPAMPLAVAALLALHLLLEGWRPQMLPAYAVAAAWLAAQAVAWLFPASLSGTLAPRASIGWIAAGGAGCLALLASLGLAAVRPVFVTPAPSGKLQVGTALVPLHPGRDEPVFQVWYPARPGSLARPAPLILEVRAADRRGTLSRSAALLNAPIAPEPARLPVLLFFPGWGGIPSQNTILIQDLASHGYVVAAADAWSPAFYPDDPLAARDLATPLVFDSDEAVAVAAAAGTRNAVRQSALARRLLDRLAALDARDPSGRLTGRLALDRVGILGFSFGGSVAVETAVGNPRIAAVANLDGGVFTDAYQRGFDAPYLLLSEPPATKADLLSPDPEVRREAASTLEDEARLAAFLERHGGVRAIINGAAHGNFTDAPLLRRWRKLGGRIDPDRARAIVDTLLQAFFDHLVRGAPAPVPDRLPAYPEVTIMRWPAPAEAAPTHAGLAPAPMSQPPAPEWRQPRHASRDDRSRPAERAASLAAAAFAAEMDLRRPGALPP